MENKMLEVDCDSSFKRVHKTNLKSVNKKNKLNKHVNFETTETNEEMQNEENHDLIEQIRKITKTVRNELTSEISNVRGPGPSFGYPVMCFSPTIDCNSKQAKKVNKSELLDKQIEEALQNNTVANAHKFIRMYDIDRIREERILKSFTIGRKLKAKENTDRRINTEIENMVQGLCVRKPKVVRKSKIEPAASHHNTEESAENDVEKDLRRRLKKYKVCQMPKVNKQTILKLSTTTIDSKYNSTANIELTPKHDSKHKNLFKGPVELKMIGRKGAIEGKI